jgi:Type II secretory pathway, prepilin signal peptidase PulO and related peptidases
VPSDFVILLVFSFIFGSILGSFLNVCIYRLPREESIVFPPSHCVLCDTPIKFYHNVPIVGYLALRGKCATCSAGISPIYPAVEILSGAICALLVWNFGLTLETLFYLVFLSALIVITFIDLEHRIIPNVITFPGIVIGLIYGAVRTDWSGMKEVFNYLRYDFWGALGALSEAPFVDSLLGVILGGGVLFLIGFLYEVVRKREGMGMGDVKLLAMIGAFLGWRSVIFVIFVSSIIGTVVGISIILYKKGDLKYAIPYGPFLSFAAAFYCFTGGFNFRF